MGILVADRKFFGEIGSLDGGMKIYGGENVELGIRVRSRKGFTATVLFQRKKKNHKKKRGFILKNIYRYICILNIQPLCYFAGVALWRKHRGHTLL